MIDQDNLVVQMCAEGMRMEGQARPADAKDAFEKAWLLAVSAYEKCIAAHYFARHQPSPQAMLEWNLRALDLAAEAGEQGDGELVTGFLPSLELNVGYAYEQTGDRTSAHAAYQRALAEIPQAGLGTDRYGETVRVAVTRGLERTSPLP